MKNVYYSEKSRDWIFHQEGCPNLKNIKPDNLRKFLNVYHAWNSGYQHCECCAKINKLFKKQEKRIEKYCQWNDIAFSIQTGQMQISTGYSQWKVVCEDCEDGGYKLVLWHKNKKIREGDELSPVKGYHNQNRDFNDLLSIIKYIVQHDNGEIRRKQKSEERAETKVKQKQETTKAAKKRDLVRRTSIFYSQKERARHSAGQLYSLLGDIEIA